MIKIFRYSIFTGLLLLAVSQNLKAQPHAGQQSGGGGVSGSRIGDAPAGAPVGSGNLILFALAMAYAGGKRYRLQEEKADS